QKVIDPVKPLFHSVDFPTVNFESIATHKQSTLDAIHPTKDYAYYSDDNSLPLLKDLNVNFVTLGNNHVYDYDAIGLQDTMDALDKNGIKHSGAGMSVEEAFMPYRTTINNKPFSFVGATSVSGNQHSLLYIAHEPKNANDPFATQGGAADAQDRSRVASRLQSEKSLDYFTIYQFHGGKEYTYAPSPYALELINDALKSQPSLLVAHHPHTAQGYGFKNGVFIAYGMGNFIFDQDRLDTLLSHILVCDVNATGTTHAIGYPIYIEDYIPKLLTGDLANRFIRHISEASRNGSSLIEAPLPNDLMVFPHNYQEYIALDGKYSIEKESITKRVAIDESGYAIIDLRGELSSEYSLSAISTNHRDLTFTMGRDLLWFGSFEDDDVDSESYENSIWNYSSATASNSLSHWGNASAHIFRDESHDDSALLYFGRRIRPIGDSLNRTNKNLSFLGYFKGESARAFTIETKYYASVGEKEFGSTLIHSANGGTFDWKVIEKPIPMPADTFFSDDLPLNLKENARATKFYIRMNETHKGEAHLYVDDLAVINWEESHSSNQAINIATPHARDFIKVQGVNGEYNLKLEFTKYKP
ncbi:MAG: CapA family protein, partial [Campylobacterota bacterium]|nr:CapA family protein [Campylobacterota bacterium]